MRHAPPGQPASRPRRAPAPGKRASTWNACSPNQPMPAAWIFASNCAILKFHSPIDSTAIQTINQFGESAMKNVIGLLVLLVLLILLARLLLPSVSAQPVMASTTAPQAALPAR